MAHAQSHFGISININHTGLLRRQLISEITGLERQVHELKLQGQGVDFSLMASYQELIKSRKDLMKKLPNSWCW
ncbi:hypothetical protein QWI17_22580 [Gilvimarinus sp. SDUM040013]|uniref:Uncharacterized protein n=1 Tax=Gilvimarinus gilvus TaxID=3058038 RepID=A0ABU4RXK1_9GAMM|nr:hypothetical protein [Gilvimarinus sp. SDUM040013]MDO3388650.1 hypothetical protein [Gilvimarinus sp. SDUM040013]MDX6849545.1 hypothetical protein [Gilvimarinus sp. SDUM040013]